MKAAILTFQNSDNYGALLQAYALQEAVKKLGHDSEILNYISPNKNYSIINLKQINSIRSLLISLYLIPSKLKRKRHADNFRNQYLEVSPKEYLYSDSIKADKSNWDLFIAGSDQIWNYENTGFDKTFFLDFTEDNKNSYAASFGVSNIPEDLKNEYKDLLINFNKISVRENQGIEIIQELLDNEVEEVLDPTLLLDYNDWNQLIGESVEDEKYILIYSLFSSEKMYERIAVLSNENNIKVKVINGNGRKIKKYNFEIIRPSFLEFVRLYRDAELVITDSFHGTIFSINFNTNFYSYDAGANNFSRISNVLNMFNLQDRILDNNSKLESIDAIDFSSVNTKLNYEKKKSIEFLNDILN